MEHLHNSNILDEVISIHSHLSNSNARHRCRFFEYKRLIYKIFTQRDNTPEDVLSQQMRQLHCGLYEAILIAAAWRNMNETQNVSEPAIQKFVRVTRSGSLLPSEEKSGGLNTSVRDTLFELKVAGDIALENKSAVRFGDESKGDVDIYIGDWGIGVECKRPRKLDNVNHHVKKAGRQITRDPQCRHGILAMDTAFLQNPIDNYVPLSIDNPFGHNARLAGCMSDSITVEVAKQICKMDPKYWERINRLTAYTCIPTVVDGLLSVQTASTDVHRNSKGHLVVAVDPTIISGSVPERVRIVDRKQVPKSAREFVQFIESL